MVKCKDCRYQWHVRYEEKIPLIGKEIIQWGDWHDECSELGLNLTEIGWALEEYASYDVPCKHFAPEIPFWWPASSIITYRGQPLMWQDKNYFSHIRICIIENGEATDKNLVTGMAEQSTLAEVFK